MLLMLVTPDLEHMHVRASHCQLGTEKLFVQVTDKRLPPSNKVNVIYFPETKSSIMTLDIFRFSYKRMTDAVPQNMFRQAGNSRHNVISCNGAHKVQGWPINCPVVVSS